VEGVYALEGACYSCEYPTMDYTEPHLLSDPINGRGHDP
jgi:hypothetical protein